MVFTLNLVLSFACSISRLKQNCWILLKVSLLHLEEDFSIKIKVGPRLCPSLKFWPTMCMSLTPLVYVYPHCVLPAGSGDLVTWRLYDKQQLLFSVQGVNRAMADFLTLDSQILFCSRSTEIMSPWQKRKPVCVSLCAVSSVFSTSSLHKNSRFGRRFLMRTDKRGFRAGLSTALHICLRASVGICPMKVILANPGLWMSDIICVPPEQREGQKREADQDGREWTGRGGVRLGGVGEGADWLTEDLMVEGVRRPAGGGEEGWGGWEARQTEMEEKRRQVGGGKFLRGI